MEHLLPGSVYTQRRERETLPRLGRWGRDFPCLAGAAGGSRQDR